MSFSNFARRNWHPALVFVGACALWLTRMPLVTAYYERTYQLGYYASDADSIGIPIASNAITTVMLFPVILIVLWAILSHFPQRYCFVAWNKQRQIWSAFWTALCAGLIYQTLDFASENWQLKLPLNVLSDCACLCLWLELRAILVSKL